MLILPFMVAAAAANTPDLNATQAPFSLLRLALPIIEEVEGADYMQVVIEQQIIIRVPARRSSLNNFSAPNGRTASPEPILWTEKKGPKCVSMGDIAGMQATQRDSIDLLTKQNQRLRAELNHGCHAHDFYAGFYMAANKDGQLCAGRDQLHARTGAKCQVAKFRLMVREPR